ncbi:uncharacterized protein EDB91DRAFT_1243974 [Suillus paluster]|uniref:uncharacterized protein n=1 Tax=Suillus paluster TaxID=48578 RepID=UPI001B87AABB|nr:uncharacterized protein EDB91DRAFT_1243974 [Suillus paluster]KAG1750391.1 hypothetical protein EDB91DRAFT_1243974 [Suillus paluster]
MSPRKSAHQKKPTKKASANTALVPQSCNPKSRAPNAKPSPKKSQKQRAPSPETSEEDSGSDVSITSAASIKIVDDVPDIREPEILKVDELDQENEDGDEDKAELDEAGLDDDNV